MKHKDKISHFFGSLVLVAAFYWLSGVWYLGIVVVLFLGTIKEFYDYQHKQNTIHESLIDFSFNILGIIPGLIIGYYLTL